MNASVASSAAMSTYSGSLVINPPASGIDINTRGSDWLWAAFALFTLVDLSVIIWSFTLPLGRRLFHHLAIIILTATAISYFSMASDLGSTPISIEFVRAGQYVGETRAIWYVRYIQWVITMPLLLLEIMLGTGLPTSGIVTVEFMSVAGVVSGLVGALVPSTYKWGYFAFAVAAYFYIAFSLFVTAPAATSAYADMRSVAFRSTAFLMFIWLLYPICWGLSEGGNRITSDGEMVFYGVLDVVSVVVFLLFHLVSIGGLSYENFFVMRSEKVAV